MVAIVSVLGFKSGFVGVGEVGESGVDPVAESLEGFHRRRAERCAFVCKVRRKDTFASDLFCGQLLSVPVLNESSVGDWEEGERAEWAGFRDFGAGVLQDYGIRFT